MHIANDIKDQSEMFDILKATLSLMPRENNQRDTMMIKKAVGEEISSKGNIVGGKSGSNEGTSNDASNEKSNQSSDKNTNAMKAMQSLQTNLGAFLDMYADEDLYMEEENDGSTLISTASRKDVVDQTSEFQCCMCHSSICESPHDTPCLLVHANGDHYPCRLNIIQLSLQFIHSFIHSFTYSVYLFQQLRSLFRTIRRSINQRSV